MNQNQHTGDADSSERVFAEENMDRTAQAGLEGAFDAEPGPDPARRQLLQDAQDVFDDSTDDTSIS